jgi:xanthine permease XanP
MPRKPSNLIYGVDERPPLGVVLLLAFQHLFFLGVGLIIPVMIMRGIGATTEQTGSVVSLSMVAAGVATIIQSLNRGPLGSGYLCAQGNDPTIIAFSILAGKAGGLPLIFGMTALSGLTECILSRFLHRLRTIFPAEVTGVILTMVGLTLLPYTIADFFGVKGNNGIIHGATTAVGVITLAIMCGINVWSKGKLRFYSVLCGVGAGFVAARLLGVLTDADLLRLAAVPVVAVPDLSIIAWSFSPALIVPVMVATLSSTLKSVATITMCQKINDTDWKRPDMNNISRGILADGLASVIGGALGGMGQSLYAATVGLSIATGVTSRIIARFMGVMFIILAFLPKLATVYSIMPAPVMGAALLFVLAFMIISGIQIMMSRMIDIRKTYVIALSLMFGISVDLFPDLYKTVHPWLAPVFSSSLSVTTVLALILNLVFRIGITSRATLELYPGQSSSDSIFAFMDSQGGKWGARREIIQKATAVLNELYETAQTATGQPTAVNVEARFDELNLDLTVRYAGPQLELPASPPGQEDLLNDERALLRLSGYLIRRQADQVRIGEHDGICTVYLHFEH